MAADERYLRQVGLLVRVLPFVAEERCFALKGGTAINLFVRDLPRLSVDIDLAYLPIEDRDTSLRSIAAALDRIGTRIEHALPSCRIDAVLLRAEGTVNRLFGRDRGVQVKIEVTPVLRGCVYEPESRSVSAGVGDNAYLRPTWIELCSQVSNDVSNSATQALRALGLSVED